MPLTEIYCASPRYRRSDEKFNVKLNDCLDCAHTRENDCHFTYELLSSMFATQQDRGARITTTTLTAKCIRSEYLKRTSEYAEKPESMWASFRGTMYHGQLELFAAPGSIEEARYHADLQQGHLSGSPDLVDVRMGVLYDYKMTKEVPRFNYPWDDHVAQLNVNRWLVDNASWVEYRDAVFLLDASAEAAAKKWIDANGINKWLDVDVRKNVATFRPTMWNELIVLYMDDKGPKPITCTKSIDVPTVKGNGTKKQRVPDIWDDTKVMSYINEKYAIAKRALVDGVLPEIPAAFKNWDHPLCNFCPKRDVCVAEELLTDTNVRNS